MYPLITFLVRYLKPSIVVETGVAAGFSSYAVLTALDRNGNGRLYSSDFPYFMLPNPEKFIGILVPESLKHNWDLHIEGDEINLPQILGKIDGIDFFHYDSDKSYSGRQYAMNLVASKMNQEGIIIMDDIQDNSFFYDYITDKGIDNYYIFEFEKKYVGVIGNLSK